MRASYTSLSMKGVALAVILLLLALAPFAVAQDVHHELAAADVDGHEHSDSDLCQWVQHHTSGSIDVGGADYSAWQPASQYDGPPQPTLFSVEASSVSPSRAPPLS